MTSVNLESLLNKKVVILVFQMLYTSFSNARNFKWGFLNSQHTHIHTQTHTIHSHTLTLMHSHTYTLRHTLTQRTLLTHILLYPHDSHTLSYTYTHTFTHTNKTHILSHTQTTQHTTQNHSLTHTYSHTRSYPHTLMHSHICSLSLPHSHTLWGQVICLCLPVTLCNFFCKCYTIGFLGIH